MLTHSDLDEDLTQCSDFDGLFSPLEDSDDSTLWDDQPFSHEEASLRIVLSESSLESVEQQTNDHQVEHANIKFATLQERDALLLQERAALDSIEDLNFALIFEVFHLSECMMPSPSDVIFGKGGRLRHPGNKWFRALCLQFGTQFLENPTTRVKNMVANEIVNYVRNQGGRFLMEDRDNRGTWKVAEPDLALKKAKQLLADLKKKSSPQQRQHVSRHKRRANNDDFFPDSFIAMAT